MSHLLAVIDSKTNTLTVTCRYCGATFGPEVMDPEDERGLEALVDHERDCPLALLWLAETN